jgi:light-regulated signal transduction histidine kinase (bacteriophytochrome)
MLDIPGAVQSFGLLIAMSEEVEGQLVVRVVSENSKRIIGYSPQELFKIESFTDILSEEQADNLLDHIDFIRDEESDVTTNGPEVFTLTIRNTRRKSIKLWCAMHISPSHPDLIICEFELDDDQTYPLASSEDETPEWPEDTFGSQPTQEEFAESTQNWSKPFRILRSARKRKSESAALEIFNVLSQIQEQLSSAPNLVQFLKILVGVVKELTGFHRVMIYQFDANFNGRVVTELVDPSATKDLYKGLHFPASDIPKQARDLYKVNRVRLLYDRDLETACLVCRTAEDLENPLDLTFSYLRAMSPIHIKYLANMAVRSSMSISINTFGELWGLISCHAYGPKGTRVSFPIRKMFRLVGDTASRNIERLSYASRLQARKLIYTVPTEANPSGYIVASSEDLLKLFDADFGLLSIRGETKILGHIEQSQEALAMLEYLRIKNFSAVVTSQDIKADFPDLVYPSGFNVIAGLLFVPLALGGSDFIVFSRKGQVREVKWAGNPYEKCIKDGTEGYLEPRQSFKVWSEIVVGKCREWTEEQIETAAVLCLVYGKFIKVWRQKEAALHNSQLTNLLLANAAHEVRTPLNAVLSYLEIALEGTLDPETRDNLEKSHSASKSLIYVINDLLDLTKTEQGLDLIRNDVFNLPMTIREATEFFKSDAKKKGLAYNVTEHPGIPQLVHGDERLVRQAVLNITANALQHTQNGSITIEVWLAERDLRRVAIDIVVEDTGSGMSNQKLDALFRDLEQVSTDSVGLFSSQDTAPTAEGHEQRALGLGLAVVARIVRNMSGQLRLKSEEGIGSRFVIQLPFELPDTEILTNADAHAQSSSVHSIERVHSREAQEGEFTLVDRVSSQQSEGVIMPRTLDEAMSIQSFKSASSGKSNRSARSDVDRLIGAISEPLNVVQQGSGQHSNSKQSKESRRSGGSLSVSNLSPTQLEFDTHVKRTKSHSAATVPEHLRSLASGPPGLQIINESKGLLRAIKMPDEFSEESSPIETHILSGMRVSFDFSSRPETGDRSLEVEDRPERSLESRSNIGDWGEGSSSHRAENLRVLVAEDDPINSRIFKKRLEKAGHEVYLTVNGDECATSYVDKAGFFDVVLMDMQVCIFSFSRYLILAYPSTQSPSNGNAN